MPAGSTCRTGGGKVTPKYHTPRCTIVPQLHAELEVKNPADRGPGRARGMAWPSTLPCPRSSRSPRGWATRCAGQLTGPLQGVYDPSGHGAALFAFLAGVAESERE
ncbi:hypothetical protein [Streptomyces sp. SM11]|uniref:hypothetical protein n=1 Tax=Streptomyces sp. SM11 TaxID=565557 RepID=UPI0011B0E9E6|nr:hypothetical protein [Streptomyces sp. SM11]